MIHDLQQAIGHLPCTWEGDEPFFQMTVSPAEAEALKADHVAAWDRFHHAIVYGPLDDAIVNGPEEGGEGE